MLLHRKLLLLVTLVAVGGSLAATAGYARYLHSERYRRETIEDLSRALGLLAEIGEIKPLSLDSRRFSQVSVRLPDRNTEVFSCRNVVWTSPEGSRPHQHRLELSDGKLLLGTDEWLPGDYQRMLRSGLGHDFAALGLREVRLEGMDLEWRHPDFRLHVEDAAGEVILGEQDTLRAAMHSQRLNGAELDDDVQVTAWLTPGEQLTFHEVALDVPLLPLRSLGFDRLMRSAVTRGTFAGRLIYRERGPTMTVEAEGMLADVALPEWTVSLPGGPYSGDADLTLDSVRIVDGRIEALRFGGRLTELRLAEVAPYLYLPGLPGRVDLRVHQADYAEGLIRYLSVAGQAEDISLEALTGLVGHGIITGRLRVAIHSLTVVDDRLHSADIELFAEPPVGQAGTIDRQVIAYATEQLLGVNPASVLPGRIEYARLGVRLVLEQGRLHVRGTHGLDGRTILTVRFLNREWAVIQEPDRSYEVPDLIAWLREHAEPYLPDDLRDWRGHTSARRPSEPRP